MLTGNLTRIIQNLNNNDKKIKQEVELKLIQTSYV